MAFAAPIALAMKVAGGLVQGAEAKRAGYADAAVDTENARRSILEGEQQGLETRRDERYAAGEMIAALGGAGVQLGTGSAFDVLAESALEREAEITNIRTRARTQSDNLLQSAADKRKAARAAMLGGVFGSVGSALDGASKLRSQRNASNIDAAARVPRPKVTGF